MQDSLSDAPRYPHGAFDVRDVRIGTTVRIVVTGEIDLATAPRVRAALARVDSPDPELVVLDLERVTFIDSSGLHALVDAHEELNRRLRIVASPPVVRLLDIAGLREQLPVIEEASQTSTQRDSTTTVREPDPRVRADQHWVSDTS